MSQTKIKKLGELASTAIYGNDISSSVLYVSALSHTLCRSICLDNAFNCCFYLVFFTKNDDLTHLNRMMLYIKENQQTKRIKIVTIVKPNETASEALKKDIEFLDREYPEIKIEFLEIEGEFWSKIDN